jgi:nucleoredoxin
MYYRRWYITASIPLHFTTGAGTVFLSCGIQVIHSYRHLIHTKDDSLTMRRSAAVSRSSLSITPRPSRRGVATSMTHHQYAPIPVLLLSSWCPLLLVVLMTVWVEAWTGTMTTTTTTTRRTTVTPRLPPAFLLADFSTSTSTFMTKINNELDNDEELSPAVVLQPTVRVNGQDRQQLPYDDDDNTATQREEQIRQRNEAIMGATAAMAIPMETPMETTLQHVTQALMPLELIILTNNSTTPTNHDDDNDNSNSNLPSYRTATVEEIATLVQGRRVALYFAAGWCPMCREFEFMLPQYTKALQESAQPIQFIYVSSDATLEFQLDRMSKLNMPLGVVAPTLVHSLKAHYGIWAGREAAAFVPTNTTTNTTNTTRQRRSGVPALIVLDTQGTELAFLNVEAETIAAMADWPLDDPRGIF